MHTLHHSPGTACVVAHPALREIDAPREPRRLDVDMDAQDNPASLKPEPAGVLPTRVVDGRPLRESATWAPPGRCRLDEIEGLREC